MTGTLIHQTETGFPESQKRAIRDYLNKGGQLVVVTGDSLDVVQIGRAHV